MFQHLLKILWQRKTKNLMLSFEIFLIFSVVFAIVAGVVYNTKLYRTPLGFQYQDVWTVSIGSAGQNRPVIDAQTFENFKRELSTLPEVESMSFVRFRPFTRSGFRTNLKSAEKGVSQHSYILSVDDDFAKTMGMVLEEGRWFGAEDAPENDKVIVINRQLADALFPGQSAVGKWMEGPNNKEADPGSAKDLRKVIGVVNQYRYMGELFELTGIGFVRYSPLQKSADMDNFVVKVKPGTSNLFELKLYQKLKQLRNDWEYTIGRSVDARATQLHEKAIVFTPPVLVAIFLLIMVGFGLFGVLWQNTTRRIPEIGLRRALGAASSNIYWQIVFEQLLLSSLAIVLALVLLMQIPLTGAMSKFIDWPAFFISAGISMFIIYSVSVICALYPAWSASRLSPTEALHYE